MAAIILEPVQAQIDCLKRSSGLPLLSVETDGASTRASKKSKRKQPDDDDLSADEPQGLEQQQAADIDKDEVARVFKDLQHLYTKYQELRAASKGKQPMGTGGQLPVVEQEDPDTCPICLETSERKAITTCGHLFCSTCIHEWVGVPGGGKCPICRMVLTAASIFDAATDEEAAKAEDELTIEGNYGTKVDALVKDILEVRRKDPTEKCLVFSAWAKVLRLVNTALKRNGVECLTLAGARAGSSARADTVARFQKDPSSPKVLLILMSTGGGAAGLTLTAASRVYLMEPSINPGLEAQAAGRVHRLGQKRKTRVIRLLIEGTIEKSVLDRQQASHSLENNSSLAADTDPTSIISMLSNHPPPLPCHGSHNGALL
ncbi:hypothetical protein WJX73_007822 [Symbiochloris irregularis]|uniref:Uncharacterized protein n=1 Tax=Symbiochloris irregularis TaxID=706552 RepID=A0AAW1P5Z0_9CHLO